MSTLSNKIEPYLTNQIINVLLKMGNLLIVAVSIIIVFLFLLYSIMPKIVDVHEVAEDPSKFNGNIGIIGEVVATGDKSVSFMLLECNDSPFCIAIPVAYQDKKPEAKSVIIAYGRIKKENEISRYIDMFIAHKINYKNDDSTGKFYYSSRKMIIRWVGSFRTWFYTKCSKCSELKKKLIPRPLFPY